MAASRRGAAAAGSAAGRGLCLFRPSPPLLGRTRVEGGVGQRPRPKLKLRPKFSTHNLVNSHVLKLQRRAKLPPKVPNHLFDPQKEYHWFSNSMQEPVEAQKRAYRVVLKGLNQLSKIRHLRPPLTEICRHLEGHGVGWIAVPRKDMDLFAGLPNDTWWELTSVKKGQKDLEKIYGIPTVRGVRAMEPVELKRTTMPGFWRMFTKDSFQRLMDERVAASGVDYATITSSRCKQGVVGTSAPVHPFQQRAENWLEVHRQRSRSPPARKVIRQQFTDPFDLPYWDLAKLYENMGWSSELDASDEEIERYKTKSAKLAKAGGVDAQEDDGVEEEFPVTLPESFRLATTPWTAANLAHQDASRCNSLVPLDQLIGNQGSMEPKRYTHRLMRKKTRHPEPVLQSKIAKRMGTTVENPKFQRIWKKAIKSGLKLSSPRKKEE